MKLAGRRTAALLVVVVLAAGAGVWVLWPSGGAPRGVDQRIAVVDGPRDDQRVTIDTTFFPPAGGGKAPAVLLAHGFGGSKRSVRTEAESLADRGYAVLTWSARGFGASTGEIALNSPDYEVKDVRQLVDWLAERPEVLLDAPGDPRVGAAGGSYGGAISLMAAAYDARIDAIVPQITWYDLADALFPDASGRGPENGVFKRMWAALFFSRASDSPLAPGGPGLAAAPSPGPSGAPSDGNAPADGSISAGSPGAVPTPTVSPGAGDRAGRDAQCGRFLPGICDLYLQVAKSGRATPEAVRVLRASSPVSVRGRIRVPTLLIQGKRDSLFPIAHADANARAIAATGAPVEVAWFDGGHDGGDGEPEWVTDRTVGWFERWLKKDTGVSGDAFTVTRDGGRDPGTRRPVLEHAAGDRYPGLSGTKPVPVRLDGGEQEVATPPGGSPAALSSVPGLGALLSGATGVAASLDMPGQVAVFDSAPLAGSLQVTGSPVVRLRVRGTGEVSLFAKVYDVGGPRPLLPQGLVAPFRVTATEEGTPVTVTLPAIDHRLAAGHRLRVAVSTTDMGFTADTDPAVHRVSLADPVVTVPTDPSLRLTGGGVSWTVWVLPLAAAVIAALVLLVGRRRASQGRPGDAEVPLEITGLTKRYRDGELAVDGLSFRVERGQVLGLLGPNGAGKTTTMRMLMGLIHPDAGEIRVFGHPVAPGAPVLSRLGCFVEGPGFLPHLSGRENLRLYWRATGRPEGDAHMAEALEIAALGDALERPVRTYSQGMRQRLAIAQAMLGLPDLLVLDEPTNGLDPPQIAEMRRVLTRYARDGRTVIVSSHLLAEVEQVCDHVVVMHRGRLVAAGRVSDLLVGATSSNGHKARLEEVFLDLIQERS
ncbi:alpha/beta fold hydrolase [Sphaerisporangium sp. B11E5]|uniref:alpha/beta fold hydrolase n=1 Tax=Sphaerisporangium sp. B11E5 TaxID=3153563 RepID=UPI00325CC19D